MKINPIGIQSYQQVPKREDNAGAASYREAEANPVAIEPKSSAVGSNVAVKAKSGTYADSLSTEERRALELVFARFKDSGRFGVNGKADGEKAESGLGQLIDVKV